jgi:hypothetical protein
MVGTQDFVSKGFEELSTKEESDQLELVVDNGRDLLERYLIYAHETESPAIYHRWSLISSVGALIGRNIYIQHGHFRVFPNLYVMLIGGPGTRKSSAIKLAKNQVSATGYAYFSAEKTSKEKFLLDLEGIVVDGEPELGSAAHKKNNYDQVTAVNLWENDNAAREPKEVFICADEFNEFGGTGNLDFYTTLGNLWDWDNTNLPYSSRLKNSRSVSIYQPTISILGGNTPANFARAFPAEASGLGFVSRFIFIHGPKTDRKYSFPPIPNSELSSIIIRELETIRHEKERGELPISDHARDFLDVIYREWSVLNDPRFAGYNTRRFTQLLKLCIISSVVLKAETVTTEVVLHANTILSAAESLMPKALGEFGKGRNSDVNDKILDILDRTNKPLSFQQIFALVHNDLDRPTSLNEMMQSLTHAGKVQVVAGAGYLPRKEPLRESDYVNWDLLTEDERKDMM